MSESAAPEQSALAARIAERICTEPHLAQLCAAAQSKSADAWRETQAAVAASDRDALSAILSRSAAGEADRMYARMHLDFCDGCERHEQIIAAATEALLGQALDWYGMHASMRPGPVGVATGLSRWLDGQSLAALQRLERRIDELTARSF